MVTCIINADDFGLSPGVCRGILQAMEQGVVTAASAMVCLPRAVALLPRYMEGLEGKLGLHLQLTKGVPCLPPDEIPSLVTSQGRFPDKQQDLGELDSDEILNEFRAQVTRLRQLGVAPSHIDSHHHVHSRPAVFPAYCRLAKELDVPARSVSAAQSMALRQQGIATADVFIGSLFRDTMMTPAALLHMLEQTLPFVPDGGCMEVMTHPGHADTALSAISSYNTPREFELQCLCSPELRQGLRSLGIQLAGPQALRGDCSDPNCNRSNCDHPNYDQTNCSHS